MHISEFDYDLPQELIAQYPVQRRDQSRLFIVDRATGKFTHGRFDDIVSLLRTGDALVVNDAQVKPVRLIGLAAEKPVDVLLVKRCAKNRYFIKVKPGKKVRPGAVITFANGAYRAICRESSEAFAQKMKLIEFQQDQDIEDHLNDIGMMPLPPYIKRPPEKEDHHRYQTVYARAPGAIAAPTAGLHFTQEILSACAAMKVEQISVTLDVGLGTFEPMKVETITDHVMHSEHYHLSPSSAQRIESVRDRGGRIWAVGTTACRVLETCGRIEPGRLAMRPGEGDTDIFIYPPYAFKAVDVLVTNFHFPRTTLLMLICAFAGKELIMRAYAEAVRLKYRFYSYGDCMVIL
jgi:S-adenosylmethionine:tRNA ribosyltransferase-isomerase